MLNHNFHCHDQKVPLSDHLNPVYIIKKLNWNVVYNVWVLYSEFHHVLLYENFIIFIIFNSFAPTFFFKHWHILRIKLCVQILKSAEPLLFFVNFSTFLWENVFSMYRFNFHYLNKCSDVQRIHMSVFR